jgi:hypothetical protein
VIDKLAVLVAVFATMVMAAPAEAVAPVREGCTWTPDLLPIPAGASYGWVTAGGGDWLAGVTDTGEALLWRDGHLSVPGRAFDLDTELHAINPAGIAVGAVAGTDNLQHAIRHRNGSYEYLPETAGNSTALDVNARGEVAGLDGAKLVVWPTNGPARVLAMPPGSAPYGSPALDDEGRVVARTGHIEDGVLRSQAYMWSPDGAREPFPAGDVRDIGNGTVVGAFGVPVAAGWDLDTGQARAYAGGTSAEAVNQAGVVVGAGLAGEPMLWTATTATATPLPAPSGYHPGAATAINAHEAGGFVSPTDDLGAAPVRWRCR